MRVLYVTPELSPWAKAGGLGDVSRDLPAALALGGADVRILVPAYPALRAAFPGSKEVAAFAAPGGAFAAARLLEARIGALTLYLLDCPAYYDRPGTLYQAPGGGDWPDNHLRFGLLSRVAALSGLPGSALAWRPELIHCNDWQTGLAPAYIAYSGGGRPATVLTVHNLAYQGNFGAGTLGELALPPESFTLGGVEFYGQVSFLKAGLRLATRVNTVSPSYAQEIRTPQLGFGLDGLLRERAADLSGILNGIDETIWDPAKDASLVQAYDAEHLERKAANKIALQRDFGLTESAQVPLLGMVGRLVDQKGVDLVIATADEWVRQGLQLALQGSGSPPLEEALRALAGRHPRSIGVRIGFDERSAHRIEAGADIFLMPSRFEPCGLNQLYSMRYGTPPVARRTGGLADSIVDATPPALAQGKATGFLFDEPSAQALGAAVERAVACYRTTEVWRRVQRAGMSRDFSWARAARSYGDLYAAALAATGG